MLRSPVAFQRSRRLPPHITRPSCVERSFELTRGPSNALGWSATKQVPKTPTSRRGCPVSHTPKLIAGFQLPGPHENCDSSCRVGDACPQPVWDGENCSAVEISYLAGGRCGRRRRPSFEKQGW